MVVIPSAYDSLTYALGSNPSNGSASLSGSTVTYTPAANYNGTDSFTFTVSDGMATSEIAEVQIAITAVNDLPVLEDITVTSVEDETSIILLSGIDVDGDSLTLIIDTGSTLGTATLNGSDVVYIPQPDYHGIDTFSYTALDGFGLSNRAEVSIVLTPVNDVPSVDSLSSSGNTGEAQIVTLSGYDPDGDALSYLLTKQPDQGDVVLSGSTVVYTPNSGFVGTDRITYLANDGQAVSAMASISFTVGSSGEIIPESATPVDSTSVDLSGPVLTILPIEIDFGQVRLGRQKESTLLVINNTSSRIRLLNFVASHSSVEIDGISIYDSDGPLVSESDGAEGITTLRSGQEAEVSLEFRPNTTGVFDEILRFSTSVADFDQVEIPLRALVVGSTEAPSISSPMTMLDFGEVVLGEATHLNLLIRNEGNALLNVINAISDNLQVRVAPKTFAVQPSDSRTVDVQLIALPNKPLAGDLTFNSDDPNNPNFVMPWSASLVSEAFLAISQIKPSSGEILVDIETNLQLTFDDPLFRRGRYLGLDVELFPSPVSGPLMDDYEVRGDGRTVLFPVRLAEDTDYRLVVFSASSIGGSGLFDPLEYSFTTGLDFQPKGQIRGSISTDLVSDEDVVSGFVSVFDEEKKLVAKEPLAADGSFVVEDLPEGEYQVITEVDFPDGTSAEIAYDADGDEEPDMISVAEDGDTGEGAAEEVVVEYVSQEVPDAGDFRAATFQLDLDATSGNQSADALGVSGGQEFQVAAYGTDLHLLTGYVVSVDYDSTALQLIRAGQEGGGEGTNVLKTGSGIPIFMASALEGNTARSGGALLAPRTGQAITGEGLLAVYRFEAVEGFTGETTVTLSEIIQRSFSESDTLALAIEAVVRVDKSGEAVNEEVIVDNSPIRLDADLAEGDQAARRVYGVTAGDEIELQLVVEDAPEIDGWSANIGFDPAQVGYVRNSYVSSNFITGIFILENVKEDFVGLGGASLSGGKNEGDGVLGTLQVEILDGFVDSTELVISLISLRETSGASDEREVEFRFVLTSETLTPQLPGDFDLDGRVGFHDFFIFADVFGTTNDVCDLNGDGMVGFPDFFIFADNFGASVAKLFALAREYIGLPVAELAPNHPNPFNSRTTLRYSLIERGPVELSLFNLQGQLVRQVVAEVKEAGSYEVSWDGTDEQGRPVASGIYLSRLKAGRFSQIRKMMFMK